MSLGGIAGIAARRWQDTHAYAFLWTPTDGMRDLGTLGGPASSANAVNATGQVVGVADVAGGTYQHAFSWTSTDGMRDLGALGGASNFASSYATAVNAAGQVVGVADLAGTTCRYAFSSGLARRQVTEASRHLGGLNSFANAVNATGQVVGTSFVAGDSAMHAFSWTQADGMRDAGTLGGPFSEAIAVNATGQFVGYSFLADDAGTPYIAACHEHTSRLGCQRGAAVGVSIAFSPGQREEPAVTASGTVQPVPRFQLPAVLPPTTRSRQQRCSTARFRCASTTGALHFRHRASIFSNLNMACGWILRRPSIPRLTSSAGRRHLCHCLPWSLRWTSRRQ